MSIKLWIKSWVLKDLKKALRKVKDKAYDEAQIYFLERIKEIEKANKIAFKTAIDGWEREVTTINKKAQKAQARVMRRIERLDHEIKEAEEKNHEVTRILSRVQAVNDYQKTRMELIKNTTRDFLLEDDYIQELMDDNRKIGKKISEKASEPERKMLHDTTKPFDRNIEVEEIEPIEIVIEKEGKI